MLSNQPPTHPAALICGLAKGRVSPVNQQSDALGSQLALFGGATFSTSPSTSHQRGTREYGRLRPTHPCDWNKSESDSTWLSWVAGWPLTEQGTTRHSETGHRFVFSGQTPWQQWKNARARERRPGEGEKCCLHKHPGSHLPSARKGLRDSLIRCLHLTQRN